MKKLICIVLIAIFLLCSCSQNAQTELFAMDTYMHLSAYGISEDELESAAEIIKDFDRRFAVNGIDSELYSLARNGRLENPSSELLAMLECAKILYERTDGAYDVTSYALSRMWQNCEDEGVKPTQSEINAVLDLVGMGKITFDKSAVVLNGVVGIDLGSIAKGYAAQKTVDKLVQIGADGGILNLGGNVSVFGKKQNGEPFKIGITDPQSPDEIVGYVEIESGNVVTSGKYNRNFVIDGTTYNHIIDARTGMPCDNGVASVTVICDDGMMADALSTALLLLGKDGAIEYYNEYGGFEAIIVMDNGQIVQTSAAITFYKK